MHVNSLGNASISASGLTEPVSTSDMLEAVWSHLCRLLAAKASLQGLLSLQVQGSSVQRSRTTSIGSKECCQARDLKEQAMDSVSLHWGCNGYLACV